MASWGLGEIRTQDLLQLHNSTIRPHPLVHGMILAGVSGIEDFGILIVLSTVSHGGARS